MLVPVNAGGNALTGLTVNGAATVYTTQVIDGTAFASVSVTTGSYVATYAADTTAPAITAKTPAAGATDVPLTAPVTATFSEIMDRASTQAAFSLSPGVPGALSWDTAGTTMSFTPSGPLATGTTYTATVSTTARDLAGNPLAAATTWSFTTTAKPLMLLGDETVEANQDNNPAGVAEAFQYTAGANGTATELYIYIDGATTATKVVVGLYSNTPDDNPGALLSQATIATPVKGAWNSVAIPSASITGGAKYWIAVLGPVGAGTALQAALDDAGIPAVGLWA